MPKLAYTGLSHFRNISKKDFADNDIEHDGIQVSRKDVLRADNPKKVPNAVEVSDEVVAFLQEIEPGDWKVVDEAPAQAPEPDPADAGVNPAVSDTPSGVDTTGGPTTTGGSSTTPASGRGSR